MMAILRGRLSFGAPPQNRVVVLHAAGSEWLERLVLRDIPATLLDSDFRFHISPTLLARFAESLRRVSWSYIFSLPQGRLRRLASQLYKCYLLACLRCIRPKVVLTFIDNSCTFQLLEEDYPEAVFAAVQNGVRNPACVSSSLPPPPHPCSRIRRRHFFCFGEHERELYTRYGHQVGHFHPIGSLLAGYYRHAISPDPPAEKRGLCLISQWHANFMEENERPPLRKALTGLDGMLRIYLERRGIPLSVALRTHDPREREYFRRTYATRPSFVDYEPEHFSTYALMDRSLATISFNSTAAVEALGLGLKVLFCNVSGKPEFDAPAGGAWALNREDYPSFERMLDELLAMSAEDYRSATRSYARRLMGFDPARPPHEVLRSFVLGHLKTPTATPEDSLK